MEEFNPHLAFAVVYKFTLNDVCDVYLVNYYILYKKYIFLIFLGNYQKNFKKWR